MTGWRPLPSPPRTTGNIIEEPANSRFWTVHSLNSWAKGEEWNGSHLWTCTSVALHVQILSASAELPTWHWSRGTQPMHNIPIAMGNALAGDKMLQSRRSSLVSKWVWPWPLAVPDVCHVGSLEPQSISCERASAISSLTKQFLPWLAPRGATPRTDPVASWRCQRNGCPSQKHLHTQSAEASPNNEIISGRIDDLHFCCRWFHIFRHPHVYRSSIQSQPSFHSWAGPGPGLETPSGPSFHYIWCEVNRQFRSHTKICQTWEENQIHSQLYVNYCFYIHLDEQNIYGYNLVHESKCQGYQSPCSPKAKSDSLSF